MLTMFCFLMTNAEFMDPLAERLPLPVALGDVHQLDGERRRPDPTFSYTGTNTPGKCRVKLYSKMRYGGDARVFTGCDKGVWKNLEDMGWDNKAMSIRVTTQGCTVLLATEKDGGGKYDYFETGDFVWLGSTLNPGGGSRSKIKSMALLCSPERGELNGRRVWSNDSGSLLGCITKDWKSICHGDTGEGNPCDSDATNTPDTDCEDREAKKWLAKNYPCPTGSVHAGYYSKNFPGRCWYRKCVADCGGWVKDKSQDTGNIVGRICVDNKINAWHVDKKQSDDPDDWKVYIDETPNTERLNEKGELKQDFCFQL